MQGEPAWRMPEWAVFEKPLRVLVAHSPREVLEVLHRVERYAEQGCWCAGYVAYEAAPAFDPALVTHPPGGLPVAWFGVFGSVAPTSLSRTPAQVLELAPCLPLHAFAARVMQIKEFIARGETYQVNFTFPLGGRDEADPFVRFSRMMRAQRCRYGAFIETPDFAICSASPELFFRWEGGRVICKPMKGTAPRGRWDEEDERFGASLPASAKDRAENLMIVDMIRNDLGRIAEFGTVRVERLFEVERFPTVWQMTSTVSAETRVGLVDIFRALFPCASVTGAPKVRTSGIIRELEVGPRGVYSGAVGFVAPGRRARFNVAIRTLVRFPDGRARYDVGSGIVWDSDAEREYAECMAKARVLTEEDSDFDVFTTLRWDGVEGLGMWSRHVRRMKRTCGYFGRAFDEALARAACEEAGRAFGAGACRLRLSVDAEGRHRVEASAFPPTLPTRIAIAPVPIDVRTPFVFHKTTRRACYEAARALRPDADDVLLWNEEGFVTETTIANVAFRRGDRWVTPPVRCGLLAGVMREELLERGEWIEGLVRRDEVLVGEEIQLCNALRGCWFARIVA